MALSDADSCFILVDCDLRWGRDGLLPFARTGCRAAEDTITVRDALSEFFSDPSGSVRWRNDLVFRNV
ncbi:hypothetical protein RRG08_015492 [Elysia crispata]|uniref:Uncharacterized protein n=1 Tax=Elysia crispata TaxID=231223 RepID=A0AAE1AFA4_9GAST|nr:hypothetical protein RRG08_015492 [Elysia crispata]